MFYDRSKSEEVYIKQSYLSESCQTLVCGLVQRRTAFSVDSKLKEYAGTENFIELQFMESSGIIASNAQRCLMCTGKCVCPIEVSEMQVYERRRFRKQGDGRNH